MYWVDGLFLLLLMLLRLVFEATVLPVEVCIFSFHRSLCFLFGQLYCSNLMHCWKIMLFVCNQDTLAITVEDRGISSFALYVNLELALTERSWIFKISVIWKYMLRDYSSWKRKSAGQFSGEEESCRALFGSNVAPFSWSILCSHNEFCRWLNVQVEYWLVSHSHFEKRKKKKPAQILPVRNVVFKYLFWLHLFSSLDSAVW